MPAWAASPGAAAAAEKLPALTAGGTVGIVGAGMAGAACAAALSAAGVAVEVLDKGRSVGGRLAQRRTAHATYDHGAQFMRARDPGFARQLVAWDGLGLVRPWPDPVAGGVGAWIGTPSMAAPVRALLEGVPTTTLAAVTMLTRDAAGWSALAADGRRSGPYAALALTLPAPQAGALLAASGRAEAAAALASVVYAPCWTALVTFDRPLPDASALRPADGPLSLIVPQAARHAADDRPAWVLHATPAWSRQHLEATPADAAASLLGVMGQALRTNLPSALERTAHRWRYSLVEQALGTTCLWWPELSLGVAGDGCLGGRVEAAWLSGRGLAAAIVGRPNLAPTADDA